ncbi:uncharacterized protein [Eurosta solidaginis]|uniref:uncharacterized protein n=1 Tax=Eurosta solidaginis TaxID=178769 RepID=UPI0035311AAC
MATGPGPQIDELCNKINGYLPDLSSFFASRNLALSPTKSSATLFTTWTSQMSTILNIHVDGSTLPTVLHPKILGVTFDQDLHFGEHAAAIVPRIQSRNKILKSLAGSTWGKDKETLMTTYKAISQPITCYASPIWSPSLKITHWKKLQACQNTALRIATGCLLMSPEHHLHNEARILPIRERNEMLTKQFLLNTQKPGHPNRHLIDEPAPPRGLRSHLRKHFEEIRHLRTQPYEAKKHKQVLGVLHIQASDLYAGNCPVNPVLKVKYPKLAEEERILPRETRVTLAQLRSGYCNRLNSYISRINPDIQNVCPACNVSPHDTNHLFNCNVEPTPLTPLSLWSTPVETASFLGLPLEDIDDSL